MFSSSSKTATKLYEDAKATRENLVATHKECILKQTTVESEGSEDVEATARILSAKADKNAKAAKKAKVFKDSNNAYDNILAAKNTREERESAETANRKAAAATDKALKQFTLFEKQTNMNKLDTNVVKIEELKKLHHQILQSNRCITDITNAGVESSDPETSWRTSELRSRVFLTSGCVRERERERDREGEP